MAASYISSLEPKQSFHATYTTNVRLGDALLDTHCTLHVTHVFPPDVFVDPYELVDQQADSYSFNLTGLLDVELPVSAVSPEGQTLSLDVTTKKARTEGSVLSVQVPLHARYGNPSPSGYHDIPIPWPDVFWRCHITHDSTDSSMKDSYTAASIIPIHPSLDTPNTPRAETLRIPVANPNHLPYVETGTAAAVLAAFLFLVYTFVTAARRMASQSKPERYKS